MCTILFALEQFEDAPVAVAANRDESPDRPSGPPRVVEGDPSVLMPLDERAGGTWMGVNEDGLFAIVANRWTDEELAGERSRGLLVRDVLSAVSVDGAATVVRAETAETEYDGFALLVASRNDAMVFTWDGVLRELSMRPGVHVLVNVGMDGTYSVPEARETVGQRQVETADMLRDALEPAAGETAEEWLQRAGAALGDHDYGACIHHDRYRTVSASLVELGVDGTVDWWYADGPPCRTEFDPVDAPRFRRPK
ncbi:MAG: NRDE family protein [Halanaeroarchaeum sp.]